VFTTKLVLAIPNLDKKIKVEADASDYTTKEVLLVKYRDKKWKLVVFISKLLNATEHNYEIYNKKMLVRVTTSNQPEVILIS